MDQNIKPAPTTTTPTPKASEMKERVISERVVSERVIGSANPVARFGRNVSGKISNRLGGVFLGIILIIISFVVVWQSEKFDRSAATVKNLPLLTVEQAADNSGLVKIRGNMTSAPVKSFRDPRGLIYYHYTREEYEMVKSTETETKMVTKDGQDVEQTIEKEVEKPEWVMKVDEAKWADITLDNKIAVLTPDLAKAELNLQEIYSHTEDLYREKVVGVLADQPLIVVGEKQGDQIMKGPAFIISNKSEADLVGSLESAENSTWWILKIATALLFGFGVYLLLGPILLLLDIIPVLGGFVQAVLLAVCLLIGLVFTVFSSLIIHYWYILLILVILLIFLFFNSRKPKKQATT